MDLYLYISVADSFILFKHSIKQNVKTEKS